MKSCRGGRGALALLLVVFSAGATLAQSAESPLLYGLIVDNSGSLAAQMPQVKEAARLVVSNNRQTDETFIVRFTRTGSAETLAGLTSDKTGLLTKLSALKTETGPAALVDAIYLAADYTSSMLRVKPAKRGALIVITDGEDSGSYHRLEDAITLLQRAKCRAYVIGFPGNLEDTGSLMRKKGPRARAEELMEKLTKGTDGQSFTVGRETDLQKLIATLLDGLRAQ